MIQSYATPAEMNMPFQGAKLALLLGDDIIVILRDERSDIPNPGLWDIPGGGREGQETPLQCALRETREEVGLVVPTGSVCWGRRFERADQSNWFFVARLPIGKERDIVFGDEGQGWALMTIAVFLHHPKVVPQFKERLRIFLNVQSSHEKPPAAG